MGGRTGGKEGEGLEGTKENGEKWRECPDERCGWGRFKSKSGDQGHATGGSDFLLAGDGERRVYVTERDRGKAGRSGRGHRWGGGPEGE